MCKQGKVSIQANSRILALPGFFPPSSHTGGGTEEHSKPPPVSTCSGRDVLI